MIITTIDDDDHKIKVWGRWEDGRINDILATFPYHPDIEGQKEKAQYLAEEFKRNNTCREEMYQEYIQRLKRYKLIDLSKEKCGSPLTHTHPYNAYDKQEERSVAWFIDKKTCQDYVNHLNKDR